jgi:hypothetical protein
MVDSIQECRAVVPRRLRRRLLERACAKWLVPLLRCMALPVAESRKRFFVPLWVLTLLFLTLLLISFADSLSMYRFGVVKGRKIAEWAKVGKS